MAPEIVLDNQRPAEFVFSRHVSDTIQRIHAAKADAEEAKERLL